MANKLLTDEVRSLIGKQSQPVEIEVERGAIRRFAEAIGDPNPLFNDEQRARQSRFGGMIAPPTFCRSMGLGFLFSIPLPGTRVLDGGSEWQYNEPIRPGDRITLVTKLADLRESEGRLGPMLFVVIEFTYTNQFGQLCAVQRSTAIRY